MATLRLHILLKLVVPEKIPLMKFTTMEYNYQKNDVKLPRQTREFVLREQPQEKNLNAEKNSNVINGVHHWTRQDKSLCIKRQ